MATGQYQHQAKVPYSPGMTYAGDILKTTPLAEKHGFRKGDKGFFFLFFSFFFSFLFFSFLFVFLFVFVCFSFFFFTLFLFSLFLSTVTVASPEAGPRSLGRYQKWGGCASFAIAPFSALRPFPSSWTYEEACCFAYGYDTSYHCLIERGEIKEGETILIHGATGGVGISAVRIALLCGLKVFATTRSESKVDFLKKLGVHEVIVVKDDKPFHPKMKELTKGKGVDVVYDGVGGDFITVGSMKSLKFGGKLLIVGWASTPNVGKGGGKRGSSNPNKIPTNLIMMKRLNVLGCPAMISIRHDPSLHPKRVEALKKWMMEGEIASSNCCCYFPFALCERCVESESK